MLEAVTLKLRADGFALDMQIRNNADTDVPQGIPDPYRTSTFTLTSPSQQAHQGKQPGAQQGASVSSTLGTILVWFDQVMLLC